MAWRLADPGELVEVRELAQLLLGALARGVSSCTKATPRTRPSSADTARRRGVRNPRSVLAGRVRLDRRNDLARAGALPELERLILETRQDDLDGLAGASTWVSPSCLGGTVPDEDFMIEIGHGSRDR